MVHLMLPIVLYNVGRKQIQRTKERKPQSLYVGSEPWLLLGKAAISCHGMRFWRSGFSKWSSGSLQVDFRHQGILPYMGQSPPKLFKLFGHKFTRQPCSGLHVPSWEKPHKSSCSPFPFFLPPCCLTLDLASPGCPSCPAWHAIPPASRGLWNVYKTPSFITII